MRNHFGLGHRTNCHILSRVCAYANAALSFNLLSALLTLPLIEPIDSLALRHALTPSPSPARGRGELKAGHSLRLCAFA